MICHDADGFMLEPGDYFTYDKYISEWLILEIIEDDIVCGFNCQQTDSGLNSLFIWMEEASEKFHKVIKG